MQVVVSTRDCSIAVAAAIADAKNKIAEARELHRKNAFEALYNGAVHNGLDVNEARRKEMEEMVDRDIEHMMSHHPLNESIKVFEVQLKMLDYTDEDQMVLDEQDFNMLQDHLPAREKTSQAA